jgi:hypothetical protein
MGLRSDSGVVEVPSSCGGGDGWTEEDETPSLVVGGGDDGHTTDPVMGSPPSGPLATYLGARVLVGLTWILSLSHGPGLGGESSTGKISTGFFFFGVPFPSLPLSR